MTDESGLGWPGRLCQVIAAYALKVNSQAGTDSLIVQSLNCDHWLILGVNSLSHQSLLEQLITDDVLLHALVDH